MEAARTDGWEVIEVDGQERAHLMPAHERDLHDAAEDCACRPITGRLDAGRLPVWVHGLR